MTVVVTGSSGFIGSHLSASLRALGKATVGVDRAPSPAGATIQTDLADPSDEALDALRTADAVWHLAAGPGIRDRRLDIALLRHRDNVVAAALADLVCAVSEALASPAFVDVVPANTEAASATRADTTRCAQLPGITFATDLRALVTRQIAATAPAPSSRLQEVR